MQQIVILLPSLPSINAVSSGGYSAVPSYHAAPKALETRWARNARLADTSVVTYATVNLRTMGTT